MKKLLALFAVLLLTTTANATLIFSDISYTSNSVSFRATGDLSGYDLPARPQYFSIGLEGDLFGAGVNPNISWSNAIFEGATVASNGYSGDWASWNNPGAWLRFSSPLSSSAIALGEITTLTLGADVLNEGAAFGEIVFNWDVDSDFTTHTELGRYSINAVPEPSLIALLGFSLLGFGFVRRKRS